MTELLARAFEEASYLSEEEQDALANWIIAELASEQRWRKQFDDSEEVPAGRVREPLTEYDAGQTQLPDVDVTMKVTVTEQGLVIPKRLLEGMGEVEIRKHRKVLVIKPTSGEDPILKLGTEPVLDTIEDASANHDRYLYCS